MKSKSLMLLALLAAAPVASQAAVVEMNDAELSAVEGQAFSFGWNLNPALGFGFSNSPDQLWLWLYRWRCPHRGLHRGERSVSYSQHQLHQQLLLRQVHFFHAQQVKP